METNLISLKQYYSLYSVYYDSLPKSYQYLATYICLCHLIRQLITMKSNVSATLALYLCICQPVCPHLFPCACSCLYLSVSVYNCGGAFVWVCVCSLHHAVRLLCSQCLVQ